MPYKILLFFLFALLCTACRNKQKKSEQFALTDFKRTQNLSADTIVLPEVKMPIDICVIPQRNLSLVTDLSDTCFIKAYELNSGKFIRAFAKKGPGPNEQMDCHKLQCDSARQQLFASDLNKRKIFVYALDDIIKPAGPALPVRDVTLDTKNIYRPVLLNNSNWLDYFDNQKATKPHLFALYDGSGQLKDTLGAFPPAADNYTPAELQAAYCGGFSKSVDGNHIVLCYYNADYIDVYDNQAHLQKRVQGPDHFESRVKTITQYQGTMVIPDKNSRFAYSGVPRMNGDELYVLYKGRKISERGYHTSTLLGFNTQLKPQVAFHLSKPVFVFDMDWGAKIIYALNHEKKITYLVKYRMP